MTFELPEKAIQPIAEHLWYDYASRYDNVYLTWEDFKGTARELLEAVAPILAEHIASLIEARRCPSRELCETCTCRPEDARLARKAFTEEAT